MSAHTYPLSPLQQGMVFHAVAEPRSGVDIEQLVITLPEPVDAVRLRAAWERVVSRHEILRTSFRWDADEPLQVVEEKVALPFDVEVAPDMDDARFAAWLREDRACGFQMDAAPLLRFRLFQLGAENWRLVWTFHHAILDGRSFPILIEEAFQHYDHPTMPDPPRTRPFHTFIEWQRAQDPSRSEIFWRKKLAGFRAPTPLVVEGLDVTATDRGQGDAELSFTPETTAELKNFARNTGVTLNTLVQGAWAILLSRYSGEEDVCFGATRACRRGTISGAETMVGLFINTVPIRTRVRENTPLSAWLQELRQLWLDIRPHEHTPLTRAQAWSDVPPGKQLFNTLVVFENYDLRTHFHARGGAWATRDLRLHEQTNFPICLAAYAGASLRLVAEFDRARLGESTVRRMLGHLHTLLEAMPHSASKPISDLPMLPREERMQLLTFKHAALSPHAHIEQNATLHGLFAAQAARTPDATALVQGDRRITYAQLDARTNAVAIHLASLGIGPENIVGLCMERTPDLVVGLLGILKANAAYLPIDLSYPPERLAFMMEDARAPVLLTQRSLVGSLPKNSARIVCIEDIPAIASDRRPATGNAGQLCYVLYTSGSTGKPKGCCITHHNVTRLFTATQPWFTFDARDVWTLFHSTAFDFSVWEIWGALLHGGTLVVVPFETSRSPDQFHELLVNEHVTVLNQTPSAFRQLIAADSASQRSQELALRLVIFGGEALEMQSLAPWFTRHGDTKPQLVNMYGITETTVHVTYRPLRADDVQRGSVIGVPIPDLQLYILDPHLRPVPIGVSGEMFVAGEGLARGYLRRPELTKEKFIHHPFSASFGEQLYRTGDLARRLPGGDIEYLGRIDQQVKIRGFRIELGEIESVLVQHPHVREAAVLARESEGNKRLVAWFVPANLTPAAADLRAHLARSLPDYMIPSTFVAVEKMPLTANGKLDHRALPEPTDERPDIAAAFIAPRNSTEQKLADIWQRILKIERVGIHDNFFELGGDSILSILVVSKARAAGIALSPKLIFNHPTIASLAEHLGVSETPRLPDLPANGEVPLTPIQQWFFAHDFADAHHWNQSFALTLTQPVTNEQLTAAIGKVLDAHPVFRLRFTRSADGWHQHFVPTNSAPETLFTSLAELQSSFRLDGPLIRFALVTNATILIAVHHLIMDGVSWRILLEDLDSALRGAPLPAPTTGFHTWARTLASALPAAKNERAFWSNITSTQTAPLPLDFPAGENTEASAHTVTVTLDPAETNALLHRLPSASGNVQDALLAALAQSLAELTGSRDSIIEIEGHGREEAALAELARLTAQPDLSHTIGWFTTIFPVHLRVCESPSETLAETSRRLREQRSSLAYSFIRAAEPSLSITPGVLFNYLGQFDQTVAGLDHFRFSDADTGAWHAPAASRTHPLEINCIVLHDRLEARFNFSTNLHCNETIERLAGAFASTLRTLIATPDRFNLVKLDASTHARLTSNYPSLEDIYPLSPMQRLFYALETARPGSGSDQWHCRLHGPLDAAKLQSAWAAVAARHPTLRTAYAADTLEPLQIPLRDAPPAWHIADLRTLAPDEQNRHFNEYLAADSARPFDLAQPPLTRLALFRVGENEHRLVWTHHHLEIDGWSWPLIFRELSALYTGAPLAPARPYRDFIAWLAARPAESDGPFWREHLRGFHAPIPLPFAPRTPHSDEEIEVTLTIANDITEKLQQLARKLRTTSNVILQSAWALLLAHHSGTDDVVFGAAFSGRPAELEGAERIVGHFVNNLPIRARISPAESLADFVQQVHGQLALLAEHQSTPLPDIQGNSELPWNARLFSTLLVFQNYIVSETANHLGDVAITALHAPVRTNYPLTLVVNPDAALALTLIAQPRITNIKAVAEVLDQLAQILTAMARTPDARLHALTHHLPFPCAVGEPSHTQTPTPDLQHSPASGMEETVAQIWHAAFGREVGVTDNFFDLGGHSLLMLRVHARLCAKLERTIPIVKLFQHPTIRAIARYLDGGSEINANIPAAQDRAAKARAALAARQKHTKR